MLRTELQLVNSILQNVQKPLIWMRSMTQFMRWLKMRPVTEELSKDFLTDISDKNNGFRYQKSGYTTYGVSALFVQFIIFFHYPALCHAHIDFFHRLIQNRNCDHHKDCIDHCSRKRCKCSHRSRCESTSHDHHRYGSHNKFHDHVDASVNHGTDHRCSVFFLFITGCHFSSASQRVLRRSDTSAPSQQTSLAHPAYIHLTYQRW